MADCPACQAGSYRGANDLAGCIACDASSGHGCEAGAIFPSAKVGYFAQPSVNQANQTATNVVACIPHPYACLGTCSDEVAEFNLKLSSFSGADDDTDTSLASCGAGIDQESCTDGYEGPRCSTCTAFDPDATCSDETVNGYYRLESRCEPCPCTLSFLNFPILTATVFGGGVALLFFLDMFAGGRFSEHSSIISAPLMVAISFCQTIAVFLDVDIPWPSLLRSLMLTFSTLNFNIELMRPECYTPFGALEKVLAALALPAYVFLMVAVYALIKLATLHGSDATPAQRHSEHAYLWRKMITVATILFAFGAISFVKSFVRAFDCINVAGLDDEPQRFLVSAPEIECTSDDTESDYPLIKEYSTLGLLAFGATYTLLWLSLVKSHMADYAGVHYLSFIADKFQDAYYYWQMVIVTRKVTLTACFVLFPQVIAVLLSACVVIISLGMQIAAEPYEDSGTNWTETLSLAVQLFMLVAGPVFTVLNDPDSGIVQATYFRQTLELSIESAFTAAVVVSVLVQLRIWRAVTTKSHDGEHEDYKVRTEMHRLAHMTAAIEKQKVLIEELKLAHEELVQEREDMKALSHSKHGKHTKGGKKQSAPAEVKFTNPLEGDDAADDPTADIDPTAVE
jgi:hypothetical protein